MTDAPIQFLPHGATIQAFHVPLSNSNPSKTLNIVQGFPTASLYKSHNAPYFGETIGRVANRISEAQINSLNGQSYQLAANNGPHSLHGGNVGWGKRDWDGPKPVGVRSIEGLDGAKLEGGESVEFKLRSEDGEEGFPGTVNVSVVYTAGTQKLESGKEARVLGMEYEVTLVDGAEETVVNMTNHSYFNLTGSPTIEGTKITLSSTHHLPLSSTGIPTSTTAIPYPSLTANQAFTLGATDPDIDDCFIIMPSSTAVPIDTRSLPLTRLISAFHPQSKVHLEVLSTEPAFQFYTGKYIDVPEVDGALARGPRSGFCVEPSRFVNAVNEERWKGQVILKKGEVYGARNVYRAWCDGD